MSKKARHSAPSGSPPSKRLYEIEWGTEEDDSLPESEPRDDELPGTILAVPDRLWGFESVGREDHPGVCTACSLEALQATLLKGRDAATDRGHPQHRFVVEPSKLNGLSKATSFELIPLYRPLRRVRLLVPNRRMGTLEAELLTQLRELLTELFPAEG
jgi:hypothetical protein